MGSISALLLKEVASWNKKSRTCEQDLWKAGIFSNIFRFVDDLRTSNIMMNLKIITAIFALTSRNSRRKMMILVKPDFLNFFNRSPWQEIYHWDVWQRRCLSFLYQSHALFDNNIPSKIFYALIDSEIPHIARKTTDMVNMVTRVDLLTIRIKAR